MAWERGLNPISVLVVASITGAGGGVIRDVLLNEMPLVLYQEIYISAVAAGGVALMVAGSLGAPEGASFLIAMAVTTLLRAFAIHWEWSLPRFSLPRGPDRDDSP